MKNWELLARRLKDIPALKSALDKQVMHNFDYIRPRQKLLDGFFNQHFESVDIALILDGVSRMYHLLAYYLEDNNAILYRPKASHKKTIKSAFMVGNLNPNRSLLIFDEDAMSGKSLKESRDFFVSHCYDCKKIFAYMDYGCHWRDYATPELMPVDKMLKDAPVYDYVF